MLNKCSIKCKTYRDHLLQGFEIPALVFFGNNMDGNHNNKVVSRCISNLILVINEDVAKSLQLDEKLIIPIDGLLKQAILLKCHYLAPTLSKTILLFVFKITNF
jgi:hypothetical protein